MRIRDLCQMADQSYVAQHEAELNKKYIASSDVIYSDGTNSHYIDAEGYINIENISSDTSYIIFIDQAGQVYLGIYQYIEDSKFKEIMDNLKKIRLISNGYIKKVNTDNLSTKDGLIDMNNLICSECGSKEFTQFKYVNTIGEIECRCKFCRTNYTFAPSRYYFIKSKTVVYPANKYGINVALS